MFDVLRDFIKRCYGWLWISFLVTASILYTRFCSWARDFQKKPNIIFIMADDMGYGDPECYNEDSKIPTPNMNRLARDGVQFTDAHTPGSVCTPTRYGVLTGRYMWRRDEPKEGGGWGYFKPLIDTSEMNVASFLKDNGYRTACIGKWHLGLGWGLKDGADKVGKNGENIDYTKPIKGGPIDLGFDYFFGIPASLDMPPYCFIENDHTVGVPSVKKKPLNTLQWDRGGVMVPGWKDGEVAPRLTEEAIQFLRRHSEKHPDSPFFLYFVTNAPHTPCIPPPFIEDKSGAGKQGDMVAFVDWSVGRVIHTLDSLGLTRNTLVIVTSDNGPLVDGPPSWHDDPPERYDIVHNGHKPAGELKGQKGDVWEGGHRVPFIAYWEGKIEGGRVCNETICLTDLLATTAALIDKELPEGAGIDSYNILPAILGEDYKKPLRGPVIHNSSGGMFAIRTGSWKLCLGRGSGGFSGPRNIKSQPGEPAGQLYNLKEDFSETHNLWKKNPVILEQMTNDLIDYILRGGGSKSFLHVE